MKFSKCHNFFSSRQIDLKIGMWSDFCINFDLVALARFLHVNFCVFCHHDLKNGPKRAEIPSLPVPPQKNRERHAKDRQKS